MSLESEAIVVGLENDYALLEVQDRQVGCGRCHEVGGCGNTMLAQMRPLKEKHYRVTNEIGAHVGDRVVVSMPDGALWRASVWSYLLPLFGLVVGAALGTALGSGDGIAVLGSLFGLSLGVAIMKLRAPRDAKIALTMRFKHGGECFHGENGTV